MLQCSWIYSDTNKPMRNHIIKNSYLLVPEEFQNEYGSYIVESCYDGYGFIANYDIYELIALWNKAYINAKSYKSLLLKNPKLEDYKSENDMQEEYFKAGIEIYNRKKMLLTAFCDNVDIEILKKKYGTDCIHRIGTWLIGSDTDNFALHYPLKLVSIPQPYTTSEPSIIDINQGW